MKNLFSDIPDSLTEESIETISSHANVRIERIISHGHASEKGFWYDQDKDEFVLLIQGEAELEFEDGTMHLKPGDYMTIDAHRRHRVKWTMPDRPTLWLAIFINVDTGNE